MTEANSLEDWSPTYDGSRLRRLRESLGMSESEAAHCLLFWGLNVPKLEQSDTVPREAFMELTRSGGLRDPRNLLLPDAERRTRAPISSGLYAFLREKRASEGRNVPYECEEVTASYKETQTSGWMIRLFWKNSSDSLTSYRPDEWLQLLDEYKAFVELPKRHPSVEQLEVGLDILLNEQYGDGMQPLVRRRPVLVPCEPHGGLTFLTIWFSRYLFECKAGAGSGHITKVEYEWHAEALPAPAISRAPCRHCGQHMPRR